MFRADPAKPTTETKKPIPPPVVATPPLPSSPIEQRPKTETKPEKPSPSQESYRGQTEAKLQFLSEELEEELKKHLKRQAAAHAEHLEDALVSQRTQLEAQYQREISEALIKERDIFNREIAMSIARLNAIESALEGNF